MARVTTMKTNFTAGELSARLKARVDIARFQNGAEVLLNAYALVHGGARSRDGTRYRAAAKTATKQVRMIPFVVDRDNAYALELGETYMRFFTGAGQITSGGSPYEISTPWDDTDLDLLKYVQAQDTMFLAHPDFPMRKLVRFGNTAWKLSEVDFEVPPSEEIGERPATTLTLSALSGAAVTGTAAAAAFEASDVGRYIESGAGRGLITAIGGGGTTATLEIAVADAFASVGPIVANDWKITESPKTTCTPSAAGPIGQSITLTLGAAGWKETAQVNHEGSFVEINGGLVEITEIASTTVTAGIVRIAMTGTTAAPSEAWALRQVQWNAVDGYPRAVGLYQQRLIAGGSLNYPNVIWGSRTGEYLNFAEGTNDADSFMFPLASDQLDAIEHIAQGKVLHPLTAGAEWSMFGGVEKAITPTSVQANPDTAYGSSTVRPVRVGNDVIFVQDGGRRVRSLGFRVENEQFNAPDISVLSEHITGEGILEMAYAQNPDQLVWMVREDGYLVSMSIDRDQDAIAFARHKTRGGYESTCAIPYLNSSLVFLVVVREINGAEVRYIETFEDGLETDSALTGAVTENAVTGAVWAAGVLTITRAAHGYATDQVVRLSGFICANDVEADEDEEIEADHAIDDEYEITVTGPNTYTVELEDDPGTISTLGTDAVAKTTWTGFGHLEGEELAIVADGYVAKSQTVTAGVIALAKAAYSIEGGIPFTSRIKTLPPEVATQSGTAQGNALSIHEVTVRFYKTKGGKINGQPLPSRRFGTGQVLNQPVPEFTGDKKVENLGWGRAGGGDSDGSVTIERDQPLRMQVLGVITKLSVNDG